MKYEDIKTVEDLEKWSGERYDELLKHAIPYGLYGNDYRLDNNACWVSEERFEDTLPTRNEQLMFLAFENCFEDKEGLVKHLNDEHYLDRAVWEVFDDDEIVYPVDVPDELYESEIEWLKEERPDLFDFDGKLFEADPDYNKAGLRFEWNENIYELVADKEPSTGRLAVSCYAVDRRGKQFEISQSTTGKLGSNRTVLLAERIEVEAMKPALEKFGAFSEDGTRFTFSEKAMKHMRTSGPEFIWANTVAIELEPGKSFTIVPSIETRGIEKELTGDKVRTANGDYQLLRGKTAIDVKKMHHLGSDYQPMSLKKYLTHDDEWRGADSSLAGKCAFNREVSSSLGTLIGRSNEEHSVELDQKVH